MDIEKIITKNELVFDTKYYDAVVSHEGEMKLTASNAVICECEEFLKYLHTIAWSFWKWISENHPESDTGNFETSYDEQSGEKIEICYITNDMLGQFDYEYEKYKNEHMPDALEIKKRVESLLNKMRKDLGNDEYKFK